MIPDIYCKKAIEVAKDIQADIYIHEGVNWMCAENFPTEEEAIRFESYCRSNGCDVRGGVGFNGLTYNVSFR